MRRSLLTLALGVVLSAAMAQSKDVKVVDTEAMRQAAAKQTAVVDKAVKLTPEQRLQVTEVYMANERQKDALKQRYDMSGMSEADRETDMKAAKVNLDKMIEQGLSKALTMDQVDKWKASKEKK